MQGIANILCTYGAWQERALLPFPAPYLLSHSVVVEERLVNDGVVPVETDAAQMEDGRRAEGNIHCVVHLQQGRRAAAAANL